MPKKYYPGGFRLTKKTAAALAVRELGTARGLEREPGMPEGYFHILFGNLEARIFPDASDSSHRAAAENQNIILLDKKINRNLYIKYIQHVY